MKNTNKLKEIWDKETKHYIDSDSTWPFPNSFLPNNSDNLLDAGCGTGAFHQFFKKITNKTHAVDISPEMVKAASEKYSNCVISDIRKLPFQNNYFNYVFSSLVLNHIDDFEEGLKEIIRVTKHGGRIIISVPNKKSAFYPLRKLTMSLGIFRFTCDHFTPKEIKDIAVKYELEIDDVFVWQMPPKGANWFKTLVMKQFTKLDNLINRFNKNFGQVLVVQLIKKTL